MNYLGERIKIDPFNKVRIATGNEFHSAGINIGHWSSRIIVYGKSFTETEQLRHFVYERITDTPIVVPQQWISCKDQLPEQDTFVDVLLLSIYNNEFTERKTDVLFRDGVFKCDLGTLQPYCYIGYWIPIPKLESKLT